MRLIIYRMYREDLALNNLQWLMCHKNPTQPNRIDGFIHILFDANF